MQDHNEHTTQPTEPEQHQAEPEMIDLVVAQIAMWLDKQEAAKRERAARAAELAKVPADVPRFVVY